MVGRKITFLNHRFWVYIRKTSRVYPIWCFGSRITRMTKHVENHIHIAMDHTWNTRRNRYQRGTQTGWQWPPFWLVEMFKVESYTWVRCFSRFLYFCLGVLFLINRGMSFLNAQVRHQCGSPGNIMGRCYSAKTPIFTSFWHTHPGIHV